ncbi:hypothetical protein HAX54_034830, partial [Datura stramonium]|nr:hypothetical protein [Datura stramonium]
KEIERVDLSRRFRGDGRVRLNMSYGSGSGSKWVTQIRTNGLIKLKLNCVKIVA